MLTPYEYWCIKTGYEKREQEAWKRTRLTAYLIYATNVLPKDRKDMFEWLPIEGDDNTNALTPEEMKAIAKKIYKRGR